MSAPDAEALLDERSVVGYLTAHGLVEGPAPSVTTLGGGVSNVVLAVRAPGRRLVVKQSLPRLRVRDEWNAPRERVLAEAAALEAAGDLTPGHVPTLLHRDADRHVIVMEAAPDGWQDWKAHLLGGEVNAGVARSLGELLGQWHRLTSDGWVPPTELDGYSSFGLLRTDPYYLTAANRTPRLSERLTSLVEEMAGRRLCLVHGDFSPKNVLVGPVSEGDQPVWVIDFEVAHRGDPAFDVAFLVSHLTLKAIHEPRWGQRYDTALTAFTSTYARVVGEAGTAGATPPAPDWPYVLSHVGALLVARVLGKSPAEYLSDSEQQQALTLGSLLLLEGVHGPEDLVAAREQVLA